MGQYSWIVGQYSWIVWFTLFFIYFLDYIDIEYEEEEPNRSKSKVAGSVKVASVTAEGQLKETVYGQLDRQAQTEVLTDLLVKGAVHYAMEKQQVKWVFLLL